MTEGNILKSIILYSIPLILGNFMQQLYNTFDSLIVGNYVGSSALAPLLFGYKRRVSYLSDFVCYRCGSYDWLCSIPVCVEKG